ncbi:MAG TPA: hypothetical protein VK325_05135 [Pseudoxanthomonas sp.]|nr:hypothetical protein [Pseudoxanthomonas sp.]
MGSLGCEVGFLLKQLHHLVNAAIESRMRAHGLGLTFPRAMAMESLLEDERLSNAELAGMSWCRRRRCTRYCCAWSRTA